MTKNDLVAEMESAAEAAETKQTTGPEAAVTRFWLERLRNLEETGQGDHNGDQPDRFLRAPEVAERLGISKRTVYASAGSWPFARRLPSGSVRFSEKGFNRWLARQR